jgi:hypothetical protein
VVNPAGETLARRNHNVGTRLSERIFGLPYSHPYPVGPDTSRVRNDAGLHLVTNLDGTPVKSALIDKKEQEKRRKRMKGLCLGCHARSWVDGHFKNSPP